MYHPPLVIPVVRARSPHPGNGIFGGSGGAGERRVHQEKEICIQG